MNEGSSINRRRLLALGGAALVSAGVTGRLFAAPPVGPRFLLVFLRGGYDSSSLLVPYSSSYYYETRPNIAIARPDGASSTGALALNADWALAPAVRNTIGAMYLTRQVAFIPFAGTDDLSRSHFETQDSIELGQPSRGVRNFRSGFLGRLSDTLLGSSAGISSISFTDALPLAFEGTSTVPNLSLKNVGKPPFDERQARILSDMYSGHHLETAVRDGLELRQEMAQEMAEEMAAANRGAINYQGLRTRSRTHGPAHARQVPDRIHRRRRLGYPRRRGLCGGKLSPENSQASDAGSRFFRRLWAPNGTTPSSSCCPNSAGPSARMATAVPTTVTALSIGCSAAQSTAAASPASNSP